VQKGTGSISSSISGQFLQLRTLLSSNDPIIKSNLTLSVTVQKAEYISSLLKLKKEFGFNLVIVGGAEAFLVADEIKDANVPVILTPKNGFALWENQRTNEIYNIDVLLNKGIQVALAIGGDQSDARSLRFLAGLIRTRANLTTKQAISLVSSNVADIYGIPAGRIKVGSKADFVLYNGDPLEHGTSIKLVALGKNVEREPVQF